mmetsp:Transcript_24450/g.62763  ORF Transcript_24450/g.62763 Transcript_24450/m.62763 type:complete len:225 (+) Transcript_24450:1236-1910(+)
MFVRRRTLPCIGRGTAGTRVRCGARELSRKIKKKQETRKKELSAQDRRSIDNTTAGHSVPCRRGGGGRGSIVPEPHRFWRRSIRTRHVRRFPSKLSKLCARAHCVQKRLSSPSRRNASDFRWSAQRGSSPPPAGRAISQPSAPHAGAKRQPAGEILRTSRITTYSSMVPLPLSPSLSANEESTSVGGAPSASSGDKGAWRCARAATCLNGCPVRSGTGTSTVRI